MLTGGAARATPDNPFALLWVCASFCAPAWACIASAETVLFPLFSPTPPDPAAALACGGGTPPPLDRSAKCADFLREAFSAASSLTGMLGTLIRGEGWRGELAGEFEFEC